jgi:hypothetical protein
MSTQFRSLIISFAVVLSTTLPSAAQWVQTNGPKISLIDCLLQDSSILYAATNRGICVSTDEGNDWTLSNAGLSDTSVQCFCKVGQKICAGTRYQGVFISVDNGAHWVKSNTGLTNTDVLSLNVFKNKLYAGTFNGVFVSTDEGNSWYPVNNGMKGARVFALIGLGSRIFAGARMDSIGLYVSSDEGVSWQASNKGLGNILIYTFANQAGELLVGTAKDMYVSPDSGKNWSVVDAGLAARHVFAIAIKDSNIIAGTDSGVYLRKSTGGGWIRESSDSSFYWVYSLLIFKNKILAGTMFGIYSRPLSEMIASVERLSAVEPSHITLSQNYPNPFNPSTTIEFALPKPGFVTLVVFNVLGEAVGTLVNENLMPGNYRTTWDAKGLPGGMYFYRLEAGGMVEARKLSLLK